MDTNEKEDLAESSVSSLNLLFKTNEAPPGPTPHEAGAQHRPKVCSLTDQGREKRLRAFLICFSRIYPINQNIREFA